MLTFYGAYAFEDSFDSYYDYENYYQGQLQDGFQYGIGAEFEVRPNSFVEISSLREDTNALTQYYDGGIFDKYANFEVAMNYVLLGASRSSRKPGSAIEGFGGFMARLGILNIQNPNTNKSNSATKFAWGLRFWLLKSRHKTSSPAFIYYAIHWRMILLWNWRRRCRREQLFIIISVHCRGRVGFELGQ